MHFHNEKQKVAGNLADLGHDALAASNAENRARQTRGQLHSRPGNFQ